MARDKSSFPPGKIEDHLGHVECLEVAWYGGYHPPKSVTVECTRCGEVVATLYETVKLTSLTLQPAGADGYIISRRKK